MLTFESMKYQRILAKILIDKLFKGKVIVLIGPRQTGKTTLIKSVLKKSGKYLFLNGDDQSIRQTMEKANTEQLKKIVANHKVVFIDEAQRINGIGLASKIIHDQFEGVQLVLSGSSALDLNNAINEPLTGRKWE